MFIYEVVDNFDILGNFGNFDNKLFSERINWFLNKMITNDLLTILQDDCYHCHFETSDSINKIKLSNNISITVNIIFKNYFF